MRPAASDHSRTDPPSGRRHRACTGACRRRDPIAHDLGNRRL